MLVLLVGVFLLKCTRPMASGTFDLPSRGFDVSIVDRVAQGDRVVMVWAVCPLCPVSCSSMTIHRPHVAGTCTQLLQAEDVPDLAWPADSLDVLDQRLHQHLPVPASIQQLHTGIEED